MVYMHPTRRSQLEARLPNLIETEGLQQWAVAEILGVSRSWVGKACKRLDLKTHSTGPRRGALHPEWKGGRKKVGGYWYVYSPDHPNATKQRYVLEHRLAMEAKLGRYLLKSEVVHHRNADRGDNRPENLEVFLTNADHLRHELTGRCPNWTPEGRDRIRQGVERAARNRLAKRGGGRRTQPSHRKSAADSTGEGPAS